MKHNLFSILTSASLIALLASCAATTQPVLYPNERLQQAGPVQADVDMQYCMSLADNYVKDPNKYAEVAKEGAIGGAVGAGAGSLAGVITKGSVGRATAAGAAVGAIAGIANSLYKQGERSPSYQRFVEHCLQEKGYAVTGWN